MKIAKLAYILLAALAAALPVRAQEPASKVETSAWLESNLGLQGMQASHAYFALKDTLGFPDAQLYEGSFNEWSNIDSLPVDTGA